MQWNVKKILRLNKHLENKNSNYIKIKNRIKRNNVCDIRTFATIYGYDNVYQVSNNCK